MEEKRMVICRKIKLYPVGDKDEIDRVYKYIREGIFSQNKAMNQYMSALYISAIEEISKDDRKELNQLYSRISKSKKGSAYDESIKFPVGLPTASTASRAVMQDFDKACKNGLLYGKISLPTYRKDNPLLIHVNFVRLRSSNTSHNDTGIYHEYKSHMEFLDKLYSKDLEIFIKFANNITFKMILGSPNRSAALRSEMQQIFEENYKVCGSSIELDGREIILNLSISIPKRDTTLDENTVVGVDLGIVFPAVCGLNTNEYAREYIGTKDSFLAIRTQLQAQRRRLQKALSSSSGGHGRGKKLRALEKLKKRESNFTKTYNHFVSKNVVEFALKNNAKYINIEDLSGYDLSKFILRNWSYYQLQQQIAYKAEKYGIVVRKIDPKNTSRICSCCGSNEEGQRVSQAEFICKNPNCKNYGKTINADFNASRNIAISMDFI